MRGAWRRLGLRGRLAFSIGGIVLAVGAVFVIGVRHERSEAAAATREESRTASQAPLYSGQDDVELAFLVAAGLTLVAALVAGYLVAARTAAPLRRLASTAAGIDAGDLTARTAVDPAAVAEVRVLAEAFDHMLDRLDEGFSRQRRFVSDASHELRTPLTAIRGQLEVLVRGERIDPDEVRHVERTALVELARIERIVDDLLALARLDEGQSLRRRTIAVGPFVEHLAETDPGEVLVAELPEGTLEGDPDHLAQAIRNLLSNARRNAGEDGSVAIGAGTERGPLTIWVDDDGPGIPAAEREEVFGRFYRSESSRDRHSGGSGLGLSITRAIVESHGGRAWAGESPLGGARVLLELPGFRETSSVPGPQRSRA